MSETTRLGLFKHDNPSTNTNPFNVQTALNDNWNKIDNAFGETIKSYTSISEMKVDESIQEGDTCQTLGANIKNDGNIGLYNIVDDSTLEVDNYNIVDLDNGLKAVKTNNSEVKLSYIIDEIEHIELYHENSKSTVQIFHIPNKDKLNKTINIKHGFANDVISNTPANEKPSEFSYRKNASLCVNASIFDVNSSSQNYNKILGLIIHNSEIVTDTREYYEPNWWKSRYILGLKSNGLLKTYLGNSQAQDILDDGVVESWTAFFPILIDGENYRSNLVAPSVWTEPQYQITSDSTPVANKIYYVLENSQYTGLYNISSFNSNTTYYEQSAGDRYPRQIIAQNETTKDFYILSANGKGKTENLGITLEEAITLLKYVNEDITFMYMLDGGGSVGTIYKNINQINPTDTPTVYSSNTTGIGNNERYVPDFIYFSKDIETDKDNQISYLLHEVELLKKDIRRLKLSTDVNDYIRSNLGLNIQNYDSSNLNTLLIKFSQLLSNGTMKDVNAIVSNPSSASGSLNFYDIENNKTVVRAKNDGTILINEGNGLEEISNIFKNVKQCSNFNTERETGITYGYGSTTGAPFTDSSTRVQFILTIHTEIVNQGKLTAQIGFFCRRFSNTGCV